MLRELLFRLFSRVGGRQPPRLQHIRFLIYTRRGCHLCDEAWQRLRQAQQRHGFALVAVDVDTDPQLQRLYGELVPVVMVDGKLRFRGAVNAILLARLIRAQSARASTAGSRLDAERAGGGKGEKRP